MNRGVMKKIALITDGRNSELGDVLCGDLSDVLGGRVEIRSHFFENLKPHESIEADLILVTTQSKALEIQNYVVEARRILVTQRTIRESDAYRIFSIPTGTRVLVVNNLPETTMEMVALMQQLEFNHLEFIPYEEGMDCSNFNIAITPGEQNLVPPEIPTVIDIGHRCIDISTFIEIFNRLRIADRSLDQRLLRYSKSNVNLDTGVNHQYKELFKRNIELDAVINLAHEGILLLDNQGKVVLHNRALAEMLNLGENVVGRGPEVFAPEVQEIITQDQSQEWLIETKGHSIVVNRQEIRYFRERSGSYFNFQEVTYIRQLEQNLSRKLSERGLTTRYSFSDVLYQSPQMEECIELARRISGSDFTVLIRGESGTGKELLAQSIHHASARSKQPFVAVNCAAVPESLLESELFGYTGGSFTGALREGKVGLFEQANNGSIFLDEIGDMPPMLQGKLLRVLQERQIMRLGSNKLTPVNIRVIAATNRRLRERIEAGQFRNDLYYRLNALSLVVPPLRERPEDIFLLLEHFLAQQNQRHLIFTPEAQSLLLQYDWPGNIRELGNVANHITMMGGDTVTVQTLPSYLVGRKNTFEVEEENLRTRCGLERALDVLTVLHRCAEHGMKTGRNSIKEALKSMQRPLSEAEVRGVLQVLGELGMVHSSVGRGGTELSVQGHQLFNWLKNRIINQPI